MLSFAKKVEISKKKFNINLNNPIHARMLEHLRVIEIIKIKREELQCKDKTEVFQ
jgi:hypothetical protein